MLRRLGVIVLSLLTMISLAACTDNETPPDEETSVSVATEDLPAQVRATLEDEGWNALQNGSTGALNTIVEMEKADDSGNRGHFMLQSRPSHSDPDRYRQLRIENLEADSSVENVIDAGTREFGSSPAFGLQYFNVNNGRTTQSWYTQNRDSLLIITVDYPGEGEIPSDIVDVLDAVIL